MASRSLDRDYETAWPLLKTVLEEASQEPSRVAARKGFFNLLTVSKEIAAATTRRRAVVRRREVQRAGDMLTALDAFAISARIAPRQNINAFQHLDVIQGSALRVLWWIEAWERCRTDRDRGEQALITLLWLRGRGSVVQRISAHLERKADEAETNRQYGTAHRLRVGILLCDHDPTRQELTKLDRRLVRKDPEAAPTERQHTKATGSAARETNAFIVYLNHSANTKFHCQTCHTEEDLQEYIQCALHYARLETKPTGEQIVWHIGMDLVGVLNGCSQIAVHYSGKEKPRLIPRYWEERGRREWDQDLRDFLKVQLGTPTIWDLIRWHEGCATDDAAKIWLEETCDRPKSLGALRAEIKQRIDECERETQLISFLKRQIKRAMILKAHPHASGWGDVKRWCRDVSIRALCPVGTRREDSSTRIVWAPHRNKAWEQPCLNFRTEYNYVLVC